MPITDIGSYPPTMEQFSEHWEDVNAALVAAGEVVLTLQGGFTRANFDSLQTEVSDLIDYVQTDPTLVLAQGDRDDKKAAIRIRMGQFRAAVESQLPGSRYDRALPTLPFINSDESKYVRPFKAMRTLWARINADTGIAGFTPPLLLQGGYTQANFITELTALQAAYDEVTAAEDDLLLHEKQRDNAMAAAYERMKTYRVAVVQRLAPGNPLLETVPELTPPAGSTPDAVNLTGGWNAGTLKADLSWTASTEPDFASYKLRASPGAVYDAANLTTVGSFDATTLAYATNVYLANAGDQATFKVFVLVITGNEHGSNAVTVTRP